MSNDLPRVVAISGRKRSGKDSTAAALIELGYKRIAFVVSAVLTGMMGVIYAHSLGYVTTESMYRDDTNLSLIVYSLLGGMGTLFGPVIGAALLVFVTQVVLARLLDFHLFATGLLLVLLVLAAPGGVLGLAKTFAQKRRSAP